MNDGPIAYRRPDGDAVVDLERSRGARSGLVEQGIAEELIPVLAIDPDRDCGLTIQRGDPSDPADYQLAGTTGTALVKLRWMIENHRGVQVLSMLDPSGRVPHSHREKEEKQKSENFPEHGHPIRADPG